MELEELLDGARRHPGLTRKSAISDWARGFTSVSGETVLEQGPGDDAGALPMGDGYLLMSAEGLMSSLLDDPRFAGFCAVTVNVNDIYAMGGRPLGMVAVVFAGGISTSTREGFIEGMSRALEHYGVPLLGGHTTPDEGPAVAVSIAGYAEKLLRGDGARPGDRVMVALDLDGKAHSPFYAWDTVTEAEGDRTLEKLELLVELAARGLCSACRDISNPGVLGTLAMMLEASGAGALLDLEKLPVPAGVELDWWLKAYPSYGFVLAVPRANSATVAGLFESNGIAWADLGEVKQVSEIVVVWQGRTGLFLDWRADPVTGLF
jgi:uncharacterized protein